MSKLYLAVTLLPMLSVAQDTGPLAFEVALVKPSPPAILSAGGEKPGRSSRRLLYTPQGIEASVFSIRALIIEAYQVEAYQGGVSRVLAPDSRTEELLKRNYDVIAKAGHAASPEQLRQMLQTLLAERFKLSLHPLSKQQPVYRLVVGKQGSKLLQSTADAETPHWVREQGGLVFRDATLAQFSALLSNYLDRPVLDSTGIQGFYNFPYLEGASGSDEGQSIIFTAIQRLGLQLVADKAPLEYLVVDHVEQPTEN